MNTDFKNTKKVDFPIAVNSLYINKSHDLKKWRRLKVGCKPKTCELQEIMLLTKILCTTPCYLTSEDYEKLENRLIQLKNG